MASYDQIKARLNEVFCQVFDDAKISIHDGMTAADLDDWDSLSNITLVLAIEREFNVRLKTAEIGKLRHVGDMIQLLIRRTAP